MENMRPIAPQGAPTRRRRRGCYCAGCLGRDGAAACSGTRREALKHWLARWLIPGGESSKKSSPPPRLMGRAFFLASSAVENLRK
jgi:hypothetical protein